MLVSAFSCCAPAPSFGDPRPSEDCSDLGEGLTLAADPVFILISPPETLIPETGEVEASSLWRDSRLWMALTAGSRISGFGVWLGSCDCCGVPFLAVPGVANRSPRMLVGCSWSNTSMNDPEKREPWVPSRWLVNEGEKKEPVVLIPLNSDVSGGSIVVSSREGGVLGVIRGATTEPGAPEEEAETAQAAFPRPTGRSGGEVLGETPGWEPGMEEEDLGSETPKLGSSGEVVVRGEETSWLEVSS